MHSRLTRACQGVTALAALLSVLGACGLAPIASTRYVPPPPPRPLPRTIAGSWEGIFVTPSGRRPTFVTLEMDETRGIPSGTLRFPSVSYVTQVGYQGPVDPGGEVRLDFTSQVGTIVLRGHISEDGRRFTGRSIGPENRDRTFDLAKRSIGRPGR